MHIVLDPKTGRGTVDRGPPAGYGARNLRRRDSPPAQQEPPWPKVRRHDAYTSHPAVRSHPKPGHEPSPEFGRLQVRSVSGPAIAAGPNTIACLVQRWVQNERRAQRVTSVLVVSADGVSLSKRAPDPLPAWLWRTRFVTQDPTEWPAPAHLQLSTVPDERPLLRVAGVGARPPMLHLVPGGVVLADDTGVRRFDLPNGKRAWRLAIKPRKTPPAFSPERDFLAWHCGEGSKERVVLVDTRSGKIRARYRVAVGAGHWTRPLGVDPQTGLMLLAHSNGYQVRLVRWGGGNEVCRSEPAPPRELGSIRTAFPSPDGSWIVGDHQRTRILKRDGSWAATIPVAKVLDITPLPGGRVVLRSEHEQLTIHRASGEVLSRTTTSGETTIAFQGRFFVRSRGAPPQIEFLDTVTGRLRLTIHALERGWIAFTPEGRWDAAPDSESRVAVYRGRASVDPAGRRAPGLFAAILGSD